MPPTFWHGFIETLPGYDDFPSGAAVLDVGFGEGEQLASLAARGHRVTGVEHAESLVEAARARGWDVHHAAAERLPFADASFDGLVCKVVVPYTDEARAVREWSRVLRPNGVALVSYHGAGYYLRYVLRGEHWKQRIYGVRSLVNGWLYASTGRRMPGFVGDTIYQSEARLRRYYARFGFVLESSTHGKRFAGVPVFIHHRLRRRQHAPADSAPAEGTRA